MRIAAKLGLFAGGVLFGTAGIRILSSRDAKKVYTHATAAVLRAKEDVMTTVRRSVKTAGTFWQMRRPSMKSVPPLPARRSPILRRSPLQSLPRPESCAAGEENPSRLRAGESYEVQNFT